MAQANIVITGRPMWGAGLEARLREYGYHPLRYETREKYVSRLADDNAALILVDGDGADWQAWVTAPKVHNATRRVPVIVVTGDSGRHDEALSAGATLAVTPDALRRRLPDLLAEHVRVPDPQTVAELERQCDEPLPPLARQGVEKFNAGEYYPQHDLFEEQWMEETGPVRDLYRAILQVGVAYYQITRGNHRGALKMLLRSVQWLALLPDECQGVDVQQLREDAARVRAVLERMNPDDIGSFDRALLRPLRMVED